MRFIIYGVGAIGGSFAASLALAGREVVGIARGKMLAAIEANGLLFRTPDGEERVNFPCHAGPGEITFRPDDVVVMTMKSQDSQAALKALRDAGVTDQPIVCAQNGVDNERLAARLFPNMTVMTPAGYTVPGEVNCFSAPKLGLLDIGRFPKGSDAMAEAIAVEFEAANYAAFVLDEVMASKYGKLVQNLGNVLEAALGPAADRKAFVARAQAEAETVYRAAGIAWMELGGADPRRKGLSELRPIAGATRSGGSSTQSLARGTGSIETDYLNGEIVLLGRLHGVPTPVNTALVRLGQRLVAERLAPGQIDAAEVARLLG